LKGEVIAVKLQLDPPSKGEHKVVVGITAPASGFFDAIEDEFNLTKYGRYLKMEITQDGDNIKCSWAQDHDDFIFKGLKPQTKTEPTKTEPVKKEEPKKTPVTTTTTAQPVKKVEEPKKATTTSSNVGSEVEQLEKLAGLLEKGVITQKEFEFKKKKILGL
jgi:hypothetical protein